MRRILYAVLIVEWIAFAWFAFIYGQAFADFP